MKLKELKDYINSLPSRLDDFTVVNGEMVNVEDGKNLMLVNNTVVTVYVDEETSEIQILHQSEDDIKDMVINGV
jgi:hypothetical protein